MRHIELKGYRAYGAGQCFMFLIWVGLGWREAALPSCGLRDKLYARLTDYIHVLWIALRLCGKARQSKSMAALQLIFFFFTFEAIQLMII